jgi:hypothetical protein
MTYCATVSTVECKKLRWAWHVAGMKETKNLYSSLLLKYVERLPYGIRGSRRITLRCKVDESGSESWPRVSFDISRVETSDSATRFS